MEHRPTITFILRRVASRADECFSVMLSTTMFRKENIFMPFEDEYHSQSGILLFNCLANSYTKVGLRSMIRTEYYLCQYFFSIDVANLDCNKEL